MGRGESSFPSGGSSGGSRRGAPGSRRPGAHSKRPRRAHRPGGSRRTKAPPAVRPSQSVGVRYPLPSLRSPAGEHGRAGRGPGTAVALALHPHPSCGEWQRAARGRCGHLRPVFPPSPLFSAGSIPPRGAGAGAAAAVAGAAADGCQGVPHCSASPPPGLLVGAVRPFLSLALGFYRKGSDILNVFTTLLHPHPPSRVCNVRSQRDSPRPLAASPLK